LGGDDAAAPESEGEEDSAVIENKEAGEENKQQMEQKTPGIEETKGAGSARSDRFEE